MIPRLYRCSAERSFHPRLLCVSLALLPLIHMYLLSSIRSHPIQILALPLSICSVVDTFLHLPLVTINPRFCLTTTRGKEARSAH